MDSPRRCDVILVETCLASVYKSQTLADFAQSYPTSIRPPPTSYTKHKPDSIYCECYAGGGGEVVLSIYIYTLAGDSMK